MAATVGYSRAVRDGRHVYVAGTRDHPIGVDSPDDPYEQAKRCLEIIVAALARGRRRAGARRPHARLPRPTPPTGRRSAARTARSSATSVPRRRCIVVAGLLDPRWLVEIEAEAIVA